MVRTVCEEDIKSVSDILAICIELEGISSRLDSRRCRKIDKRQHEHWKREGELHGKYQDNKMIVRRRSSSQLDFKEEALKHAFKDTCNGYEMASGICKAYCTAALQLSPSSSLSLPI